MQKLIMLSMALALAGAGAQALERGGVDASMDDSAHAVDNTEMDVTMRGDGPEAMDEEADMAPAPSIALSGAAKMGVKRVDDDSSTDPDSDRLQTVAEYEVTFGASGVTDGGLVFGAAISIDEDGKGAASANGVNRPSVYIGPPTAAGSCSSATTYPGWISPRTRPSPLVWPMPTPFRSQP